VKVSKPILLGACVVGCLSLWACGGGSSSSSSTTTTTPTQPSQPSQPLNMNLDTGDVLAKARIQSETDDPFTVNGGMVNLVPPNDETADPIAVE
jgi:hypothetical protein